MVHVHGQQAQQLAAWTRGVDAAELIAVPIDVGKQAAMALVCEFAGELLAHPFALAMTQVGVRVLVERVRGNRGPSGVGWSGSGSKPPVTSISRWSAPGCCLRPGS